MADYFFIPQTVTVLGFQHAVEIKENPAIYFMNFLAILDMKMWSMLAELNQGFMFHITLQILTEENKFIELQKDLLNNLSGIGFEYAYQNVKSLNVIYKHTNVSQEASEKIRDIVASELIQKKYKILANHCLGNVRSVMLNAVIS